MLKAALYAILLAVSVQPAVNGTWASIEIKKFNRDDPKKFSDESCKDEDGRFTNTRDGDVKKITDAALSPEGCVRFTYQGAVVHVREISVDHPPLQHIESGICANMARADASGSRTHTGLAAGSAADPDFCKAKH